MQSHPFHCAVIVIGAPPCGLMLAVELDRCGVGTIVLDEKTSPARFPQANAVQARPCLLASDGNGAKKSPAVLDFQKPSGAKDRRTNANPAEPKRK
jgi:hypothetical protein